MAKDKQKGILCLIILILTVWLLGSYLIYDNEIVRLENELNTQKKEYINLMLEKNDNLSKTYEKVNNKILELEKAPDCVAESYCYAYDDSDFDLILKNNANEVPYILDYYDCSEFSTELKDRLKNVGFRADTKVVGINCEKWSDDWDYLKETTGYGYDTCKENNLHQIVKIRDVYVESTTGEVIMPYEYEKYGIK